MSDLRGRILECALDLYLDQGFTGLSMRHVGDTLGVSATALYRHYRNKEDLLNTIFAEAVKILGTYQFEALSEPTPEGRFHKSGDAYLDFALQKSKYYEMIFMAPCRPGQAPMPEDLRQKSMATFQFLVDRVQECMESGFLRKDDAHAVALCIWAQGHGLAALYLRGKLPVDMLGFRELFRNSRERLLSGLMH